MCWGKGTGSTGADPCSVPETIHDSLNIIRGYLGVVPEHCWMWPKAQYPKLEKILAPCYEVTSERLGSLVWATVWEFWASLRWNTFLLQGQIYTKQNSLVEHSRNSLYPLGVLDLAAVTSNLYVLVTCPHLGPRHFSDGCSFSLSSLSSSRLFIPSSPQSSKTMSSQWSICETTSDHSRVWMAGWCSSLLSSTPGTMTWQTS